MQTANSEEIILCSCNKDDGIQVGKCYGPTVHSHYIIECCTAGEAKHYINGKPFPLKPGQGIVFFPGDTAIHLTCGNEPRFGYWCCLNGAGVGDAFTRAGLSSDSPYLAPETARRVTQLMEQIYAVRHENDGGAELRRSGLTIAIIGEVLRKTAAKKPGSVYVNRALGIIESRCDEDLTVAQLAREVGLERSYFSTLFRRETGQTPKEALTMTRVRRAASLLLNTDLPVAELAPACGIPPENFSRVFTAVFGKTPHVYRKENKNKQ